MKNLFLSSFIMAMYSAFSQESTDTIATKQLHAIEVSPGNTYEHATVLNTSTLTEREMVRNGAFNVSDALTAIPGISQVTTGVAISKPVIRGLYGNRVQTVFSGLRFDNQQWQDEHGLGIAGIGIDRVEIIKGPASLLYGSEAVGGVINIIEEKDADDGKTIGDLNTKFISNTYGNSTDFGIKSTAKNKFWRLRAGYESNADYSDGTNQRVLNSRFDGYYLKASFGFKKDRWTCRNNYSGSLNNFGFIMADNQSVKPADARLSRTMDGPRHTVLLNILSSSNIFSLKKSLLKVNVGGQSNIRLEDEGGGDVSLNMHLSSAIYNLQWIKTLRSGTELIISNQGLLQNNTNYGKRKIIPDANISETGLSVFVNQQLAKKLIAEGGLGGNYRTVKALETENVNAAGGEIRPFTKTFTAINGMLGLTFNPTGLLNIRFCGSTGFRGANLAELSSNGLHEGTFQYEIGNPRLKPEQNFNGELALTIDSRQLGLKLAAFNNYFNNYIYLDPTTETFFGIPVFRYRQGKANLYGGEAALVYKPFYLKGIELSAAYSTVTGILGADKYLPFIPADHIHSEMRYSMNDRKKISGMYVYAANDHYFRQSRPALNETQTPAYDLFSAGIGLSVKLGERSMDISATGNNLLNAVYYGHLSRFKTYGIYNIGRNIFLHLKIPFTIK